jgi:site-specific DNA-methyltransferase (adenine-specific)
VIYSDGTFHHADCFDVLPTIPSQSIHMILTDLPYQSTRNRWDRQIDLSALWREYKRIIKPNGAIALCAQTPFDKVLGCSNLDWLRYEWIWRKPNGTGHLNAKRMPLKIHENILIFYEKLPTYNPQWRKGKPYTITSGSHSENYGEYSPIATTNDGEHYYPVSTLDFPRDKERLHPTQKPVGLFEYLIRTYTNEGETVLDNCAGVGTTAIAARNTGRRWLCVENDSEYFGKALERLN